MLASELVSGVRAVCDETNDNDLSDSKIVAALNRALQRLARLSVLHYPEMLKRTLETTASAGSLEVPALSQAYTNMQLDTLVGAGPTYRPLTYTSSANTVGMEGVNSTYPLYYSQQGNTLYLHPATSGSVSVRLRYQLKPYSLVLEQGRITSYDTSTGTLYVDTIGSSLSTSVSDRTCFFNIIDQFSGDVKGTFQVNSLTAASGKIVIKTASLGRSSVYGLSVSSSLPSTIALDDLVCLASGSCIPLYFREYTDFLIQFAVNEIKRTYGVIAETDVYALRDIEDDVKLMWSQRPKGGRVKPNNPAWSKPRRYL
jgi:hypothetical protein